MFQISAEQISKTRQALNNSTPNRKMTWKITHQTETRQALNNSNDPIRYSRVPCGEEASERISPSIEKRNESLTTPKHVRHETIPIVQ